MIKFESVHWKWVAALIFFLALSRLIPHPPNFTPLGAMAILSGAVIKDFRMAILVPLAAMVVSDALLGFHSSLLFVYGAVIAMVMISRYLLQSATIPGIVMTALGTAVVFFLITNFGAWLSHDMYPKSMHGLLQSYVAGIPFFRNTLLGNLFFTAISFYALRILPDYKFVRN